MVDEEEEHKARTEKHSKSGETLGVCGDWPKREHMREAPIREKGMICENVSRTCREITTV